MITLESIGLGILQGLTEFIPVSSSGHLVVAQSVIPGFKEPAVLFDAMLHMGTLAAVVFYYKKDLALILASLFPGDYHGGVREKREGRRLLLMLILATIPTGIIGFLFKDAVEALFEHARPVGASLLVTGAVLAVTDRVEARGTGLRGMIVWKALLIGVIQGIAVIPGISRSGMTIASGVILGLRREFAMEFSFLLAIPAVFGAVVLETAKHLPSFVSDVDITAYLLGMIMAGLVGYLSIGWLLKIVKMKKLVYFGAYCWCVGLAVLFIFH